MLTTAARPFLPEDSAFIEAVAELAQQQPVKVARAVASRDGALLLAAGTAVAADLPERLRGQELVVPLDTCLDSGAGLTSAALRAAAEASLQRWPFFAQMAPAGRVRGMLLEAVSAVPLVPPVALRLQVMRATRPALFEHSVLSALLAAHLVREGGAPLHDIAVAAAAGLLHDIGMLHIAPALLQSGAPLNGDERRPIYAHPQVAANVLARFREYPKELSLAVLEHHEMQDGSGYPRGLTGDAISLLGRLLSLAEVVTAMFDGQREYPEQRVSLLLRMSPKRFDAALVPSIHRLLRALPEPEAGQASSADASVERLRRLTGLLEEWHDEVAPAAAGLEAPRRALLESLGAQSRTLQHMLYEAGIDPGQLELLTADAADDARLRVELWALAQELQWQLRAAAGQLRRRWPGSATAPHPAVLAAWLERVEGLAQAG